MKTICLSLLLIIWLFLTVGLAVTLIGAFLFIPLDTYEKGPSNPSTWMMIGRTLLATIISNK